MRGAAAQEVVAGRGAQARIEPIQVQNITGNVFDCSPVCSSLPQPCKWHGAKRFNVSGALAEHQVEGSKECW
jgi:hypothetical protein